jgi:YVTN family beta-propeller protein
MSLLTTIEKIAPKAWKPFHFVLLGNNPTRRVERASISVAVIAVIVVAIILVSGGVSIFANGFGNSINTSDASYHVRAMPDSISEGASLHLIASVNNFVPNTQISVTITVKEPNGALGSKTTTLMTDKHGNGQVTLTYPDSFAPSASTSSPGRYEVTATFAFVYSIHTATTSFRVRGPVTHNVFVTEFSGNQLTVIDPSSNQILTNVNVGKNPIGVAFDSIDNTIFVANSGSKSVSVIDGSSFDLITTINVGSSPTGVAFDPSNDMIYVTNLGSSSVSVIDGATNLVTGTIKITCSVSSCNPYGVLYNPAGNNVYVSNSGDSSVSVLDTGTNTQTGTIAVGTHPRSMAFDPNNNRIYVADYTSNQVTVVDATKNTAILTISGLGDDPWGVAFNPTGSSSPAQGTDPPNRGEVLVTNSMANTLSIINPQTNNVANTINTGHGPFGIAYQSSNQDVYVTDQGSNIVLVLNNQNTIIDIIDVNGGPMGIATS